MMKSSEKHSEEIRRAYQQGCEDTLAILQTSIKLLTEFRNAQNERNS